jgi:hypothetical protein
MNARRGARWVELTLFFGVCLAAAFVFAMLSLAVN